jgi:hypothetical protein
MRLSNIATNLWRLFFAVKLIRVKLFAAAAAEAGPGTKPGNGCM